MAWITCGECEFGDENPELLIKHILDSHPNYTAEDAAHFAAQWQEDAFEQEELDQIARTEEYRRTGIDPNNIDRDSL